MSQTSWGQGPEQRLLDQLRDFGLETYGDLGPEGLAALYKKVYMTAIGGVARGHTALAGQLDCAAGSFHDQLSTTLLLAPSVPSPTRPPDAVVRSGDRVIARTWQEGGVLVIEREASSGAKAVALHEPIPAFMVRVAGSFAEWGAYPQRALDRELAQQRVATAPPEGDARTVLEAIQAGVSTEPDLVRETGLDRRVVDQSVYSLRHRGYVQAAFPRRAMGLRNADANGTSPRLSLASGVSVRPQQFRAATATRADRGGVG